LFLQFYRKIEKGEFMQNSTRPVFKTISRIRRHHALEHATLQLLSEKYPRVTLAGYSDWRGFWVVGRINTQDLQLTVDEALLRLKNGESQLAIHPNCGTNYAVGGLLAGTVAWLATLGAGPGWKKKLDRWPLVVTLATLALIFAQPLGLQLQAHVTTQADPGRLVVSEIRYYERERIPVHRVLTREGNGIKWIPPIQNTPA
jgi:hypothetical protein